MPRLIAAFDDQTALEAVLTRLSEVPNAPRARVVEGLAERAEQPLPPEIGGGSTVPVATPTAATPHDVAPGSREPHPGGSGAAAFDDLLRATGGDDQAADRYRSLIERGASVLLIEGDQEQICRAEEILGATRASSVASYS